VGATVELAFEVDGTRAQFRRKASVGTAELTIGTEVFILASPRKVSTHMEIATRRTWQHRFNDHDVVIEKVRPLLFGGLRPNSFTVTVDGAVVAEATGF
jgi:hypothetical protein